VNASVSSGAASAFTTLRSDASQNGDAMRQRIDHLEDVVKKLIAERQQVSLLPQSNHGVGLCTPESPKPEAGNSVATDAPGQDLPMGATGKTVMDGIHSVYLGGNDWSVVLQEASTLSFPIGYYTADGTRPGNPFS
jgi:hypothetical protein